MYGSCGFVVLVVVFTVSWGFCSWEGVGGKGLVIHFIVHVWMNLAVFSFITCGVA